MAVLSGFLAISATAQTITLTFNGANKNINYQILLDGNSYYSNSSTYPTNVRKEVTLTNQRLGNHEIVVYRLKSNSGTYRNGINTRTYGNAIYSKTFELREGYDMNIRVNGNGRVSFSESDIENRADQGNNEQNSIEAMSDVRYNQLLQTVRSRWSPSLKYTAEREAFSNMDNYFTSEQVKQLLLLISSEQNRLNLAKLVYPRIIDPANFTRIYTSVFNSSASRNSMNIFIQNNPNNNNGSNNGNWSNNNNSNRTPMANYQFRQLLQYANGQNNQADKVIAITNSIKNAAGYFSTAQIRQFLSIINAESDRLNVAKQSYAKVSDASAFTSLYDLFYSLQSRDDLNNYVIQNGGTGSNIQNNTKVPMADYQFNQLMQNVNEQWNQAGKFNIVRDAFNTNANYFNTVQVRQLLSVINAESDRLALAKLSYSRVYDPANFSTLYDLLNSQSSRNDLNNYVIQNGGAGSNVQYNTNSRTPMTDASFSQVLDKVSNHFLPWDKARDARDAFNNSSYFFNTYQIRQILTVISSENDRLELAKLAWSRVTDPTNFTQLFDLFTTQASRDDLNAYIQSRPSYY